MKAKTNLDYQKENLQALEARQRTARPQSAEYFTLSKQITQLKNAILVIETAPEVEQPTRRESSKRWVKKRY